MTKSSSSCLYQENGNAANQSTMLLCCKLFVSESRNTAALEPMEHVARLHPETVIVNKFLDKPYNRVRFNIVSHVVRDGTGRAISSPLHQAVLDMVEAAYAAINLESHSGTHPRVGVVDDIVLHPLAQASLDDAAWIAKAVAADIGSRFQVPVFLYSAAHPTNIDAAVIRRELGYFQSNLEGNQWSGLIIPEILPIKPDEGPIKVSRAKGISMIGARPWVDTYNIPILTRDVSVARRFARRVSTRGGGLPKVQALGLLHGEDSTEVACILLEPNQTGANEVQSRVKELADEAGVGVEMGYHTDMPPEEIVDIYMKSTSQTRADEVQSRVKELANEAGVGVEMGYHTDMPSEEIVDIYMKSSSHTGADEVQSCVKELADAAGVGVEMGYHTDMPPEEIVDIYMKSTSRT